MNTIPNTYRDLLSDEKQAFAYLATTMPDGSPQITPVWFDTDGQHVLINTARGRVKDRNMSARPQIALLIVDPGDPYRFIEIRGRTVNTTEDGAVEHTDRLAKKYIGVARNESRTSNQVRVIYKVIPESVFVSG